MYRMFVAALSVAALVTGPGPSTSLMEFPHPNHEATERDIPAAAESLWTPKRLSGADGGGQQSSVLWEADYDSAAVTAAKTPFAAQIGVRQTYNPAAAWQVVQSVRSPGWSTGGPNSIGRSSPRRSGRMQIIDAASVPGTGRFKPSGRAMRYELRPWEGGYGDVFVSSGYATNRAEVYARHASPGSRPANKWPDPPGSERWYSFSWAPAKDFDFADQGNGIPGTEWSLIWQLKGKNTGSPPLALELNRKTLLTTGSAIGRRSLGPVKANQWSRFIIGVKHSADPQQGWVEVWRDGVRVVPRTYGSTSHLDGNGKPAPNYVKQGQYRSHGWGVRHVTYYGPAQIGQTRKSVM